LPAAAQTRRGHLWLGQSQVAACLAARTPSKRLLRHSGDTACIAARKQTCAQIPNRLLLRFHSSGCSTDASRMPCGFLRGRTGDTACIVARTPSRFLLRHCVDNCVHCCLNTTGTSAQTPRGYLLNQHEAICFGAERASPHTQHARCVDVNSADTMWISAW
jgi:hypothetical protein